MAAHGPLALRFLDISGSVALSDAAIATLLGLCPQLRILHALDNSLGAASLAALAGRAAQAAEQQEHGTRTSVVHGQQGRQHGEQHQEAGPRYGAAAAAEAAAIGITADPTAQAEAALGSLHLSSGGRSMRSRAQPSEADCEAAASAAQPACPRLERLTIGGSGCRVKGSALRRALRCLPNLKDLRLHGCEVHAVIDPLLPSAGGNSSKGGSSKSSSKAAAIGHVLGQLSRLELMGCDDLAPAHVAVLLQHCTSLRRLALSSKQLAAEQFDRQQHSGLGREGGCSKADGDGSSSSCCCLASLTHLAVGWGAGGTFLVHAAELAPFLTSLTVHVGAAVSDDQLAAVAASCRHLERLCLQGANVSEAGARGRAPGCDFVCCCFVCIPNENKPHVKSFACTSPAQASPAHWTAARG